MLNLSYVPIFCIYIECERYGFWVVLVEGKVLSYGGILFLVVTSMSAPFSYPLCFFFFFVFLVFMCLVASNGSVLNEGSACFVAIPMTCAFFHDMISINVLFGSYSRCTSRLRNQKPTSRDIKSSSREEEVFIFYFFRFVVLNVEYDVYNGDFVICRGKNRLPCQDSVD